MEASRLRFVFDLEPLFGNPWGPPHEATAAPHKVLALENGGLEMAFLV